MDQIEHLWRAGGVVEVIGREELEKALKEGKKLRIKYGADPTAPDLHIGNAVGLRKLREFQECGHTVIFIVGDYTAKIGDPSGKSKTRPMLSDKEIKENAKTYFKQVGNILDVNKIEIRHNSEWYKKTDLSSLLSLASRFSAQRILERDDFSNRLKNRISIHVHELLYPILQAQDSIEVKADVEIGGTDQKFNMLAGRDLQRYLGIPEQAVITLELLVGTDGAKKMSKSLGNYIGIAEGANAMFGKIMSIPDGLIDTYYKLCTDAPRTAQDPREAKLELGKAVVGMYHGEKAAGSAEAEFIRVVSEGGVPEDVPALQLGISEIGLLDLLVEAKMAASKGEARRLVEQGGVKIDGAVQGDVRAVVSLEKAIVLQAGKRKFARISGK